MTPLVIIGAGGHARVVADVARLTGRYEIAGFLDEVHPDRQGEQFSGAPVLGGLDQLDRLHRHGVRIAVVAVGDCEARLRLAEMATQAGFDCPSLVHPSAVRAADVLLGPGTVLVAASVVNPGARVGAHVILNTGSSVDHDCVIEDGVHIAVGARLGGHVRVGRAAWVGLGALVKEGVRIGCGALIGAGALVLQDIPDYVVAYGSPARVIRSVTHEKAAHV